jgi:MbtH protein
VTSPFDGEGPFVVLVNEAGQHSLWPASADLPGGWRAVYGAASRQECLDYTTEHWTDIRPGGGTAQARC